VSWTRNLRRAGVLGINRRNIEFTLSENPRWLYPLVDNKLETKALCERLAIPTAAIVGQASTHSEVRTLIETLRGRADFVLKPASGAMGNGILVVHEASESTWTTSNGRVLNEAELAYHAAGIISGLYALGGKPDVAFAEERLELHPDFRQIAQRGVPDIRVIVFRGVPVMAMTRLPTASSGGRANLHQGAVGAGIDLRSGLFAESLRTALRAAEATGLGYVGADVVVDATRGAVLLELNARPGLAIQIANRAGLLSRLKAIRGSQTTGLDIEARIELGCRIAEAS
jgi:alpha-L-glutamate ligase-like protein